MPIPSDSNDSAMPRRPQGSFMSPAGTRHVKMSDFYSKFATYIAQAEIEPVCVWRYKSPVVWLVGHATWARHPKIEQFLPDAHILGFLRDAINAKLEMENGRLKTALGSYKMRIAPEPLMRALLVRILYSIPSDTSLHEQLNHNLLYRWFVGFDLNQPLWARHVMEEAFALLLSQRDVVALLNELVTLAAAPKPAATTCDFHINLALLEAWRVRLGQGDLPPAPLQA
ncbi:transposase [Bordetella genomosp. 13]|uniref:transposase n=1 Tax=Bordetella genomosp. 13 TaxID=463040 RepID=UPI0011AA4A29|nr:transposase [Bordetella genomosp. 13]